MNLKRLKKAESDFLFRYPEGFNDPDMVELVKKHKMSKMIEMTQDAFKVSGVARPESVMDNLVQIVSRSSMVSMFEKPKFRTFVNTLTPIEKELFADGLYERLHGNEEQGFNSMLELLITYKMAKWTIISVIPTYFRPTEEVFVKPMTVKGIIENLELSELHYKPRPSWDFYYKFRQTIEEMKKEVDSSLSPSNAAFTGFLMMTL